MPDVRIDSESTRYLQIQRGVRQARVLSPLLFNVYSKVIFKESLKIERKV